MGKTGDGAWRPFDVAQHVLRRVVTEDLLARLGPGANRGDQRDGNAQVQREMPMAPHAGIVASCVHGKRQSV